MTTTVQTVTVLRDKEGNLKAFIFKDLGKGKPPVFLKPKVMTETEIAEVINGEIN